MILMTPPLIYLVLKRQCCIFYHKWSDRKVISIFAFYLCRYCHFFYIRKEGYFFTNEGVYHFEVLIRRLNYKVMGEVNGGRVGSKNFGNLFHSTLSLWDIFHGVECISLLLFACFIFPDPSVFSVVEFSPHFIIGWDNQGVDCVYSFLQRWGWRK